MASASLGEDVTAVGQTPRVEGQPRPKTWQFQKVLSEHVFDKLRAIDCTLAEFGVLLDGSEIIEEHDLDPHGSKELLLIIEWTRPLHVVVVVDPANEEERLVTVYEPDPERWTDGYRRRR